MFATAERRADSTASEMGASEEEEEEEGRVGELDLRGEGERHEGEPRINDSRAEPELSWSASDDESPSKQIVWRGQSA